MSWVQVKSPNLNVQTSIGMCLKYVQDAFGSGWAGSYALQGWRDIVKKKHTNRNIPGGVYVPIWFEGYWNGVNYGHVAIYKDGVCWSSPYTDKGTHDQLGNIETVECIYGMKYIGWSEDIGGTTVIRKGGNNDMSTIPDQDNYYARYHKEMNLKRGRDISGKGFSRNEFKKNIVGLTDLQATERISDNKEADEAHKWMAAGYLAIKDKWQEQIYDRTRERNEARDTAARYQKERNAARDELAQTKTAFAQERSQMTTALTEKDKEIANLKAQLAVQSDDTKNLNALGQALQWFVSRVGLK